METALMDLQQWWGGLGSQVGGVAVGWDLTKLLALAAALGWASGLRLYAVVFLVGLAGASGWVSCWASTFLPQATDPPAW